MARRSYRRRTMNICLNVVSKEMTSSRIFEKRVGMSAVYKMKRRGPSTEPWGTPKKIVYLRQSFEYGQRGKIRSKEEGEMIFHTRSQDAQEGFDDRPCRKQQKYHLGRHARWKGSVGTLKTTGDGTPSPP